MGKVRTINVSFGVPLEQALDMSTQYWQTSKYKPEITNIVDIPDGKKMVIRIKSSFMRGTGTDWELDFHRAPDGTDVLVAVSLEYGFGTAWTIPMTIVNDWCKKIGFKQKVKWNKD
jgi:hypothetical protein